MMHVFEKGTREISEEFTPETEQKVGLHIGNFFLFH